MRGTFWRSENIILHIHSPTGPKKGEVLCFQSAIVFNYAQLQKVVIVQSFRND